MDGFEFEAAVPAPVTVVDDVMGSKLEGVDGSKLLGAEALRRDVEIDDVIDDVIGVDSVVMSSSVIDLDT